VDRVHRWISARMFLEAEAGGIRAIARAGEMRGALLMMHGEADPVTSMAASREFFERSGAVDKQLRVWGGMRHELWNECGREAVLAVVAQWILERALR
jgi:alpha-beta hydrolase superfamily lysophospholipase